MSKKKVSSSDQNIANFELVIHKVSNFGPSYNPFRQDLTIDGLKLVHEFGQRAVKAFLDAKINNQNAIYERKVSFLGFNKLVTSSINVVHISGASTPVVEHAASLVRVIRGMRVSGKLTELELAAAKENGKEIKQHVLHKYMLERKIENFSEFILFLATIPQYKPNEPELTIEGLNARLNTIRTKHKEVKLTDAALSATRNLRNEALNADTTGLVDVAKSAKLYVKLVYGVKSAQYKEISNIRFVKSK